MMKKAVGRDAPQRFWTKYEKYVQFWFNHEEIYNFLDIENTTYEIFRTFNANAKMCEKIIIWMIAVLEKCKKYIKWNEDILRSNPGKLISDAANIIESLYIDSMPKAYDKILAKQVPGYSYNASAAKEPWKKFELQEYLDKLNKSNLRKNNKTIDNGRKFR